MLLERPGALILIFFFLIPRIFQDWQLHICRFITQDEFSCDSSIFGGIKLWKSDLRMEPLDLWGDFSDLEQLFPFLCCAVQLLIQKDSEIADFRVVWEWGMDYPMSGSSPVPSLYPSWWNTFINFDFRAQESRPHLSMG